MKRETHAGFSVQGEECIPHYLTERDHPWLRALVDEYERFVGRRRGDLDTRLREPLPCAAPARKARIAMQVLDRLYRAKTGGDLVPAEARRLVFCARARDGAIPADQLLGRVAKEADRTAEELRFSLFADLPPERLLLAPETPVTPAALALQANLLMVRGLLSRSTDVRVRAVGNARAVVRHAKLRGLICTVSARDPVKEAVLFISGPYRLFRRTTLYGRALAELVPLLAWCSEFEMVSACEVGGRTLSLVVRSGDPVQPATAPRAFDSRLEDRFAREFRKAAPDWDLVREPEPVRAGGTLIFPDFAVWHRRDPRRRWLVEVAGFWTPAYISKKLERLRQAALPNLILCVDEDRNCADQDLPPGAAVVRFHRRIDPVRVLEAIERTRCSGSVPVAAAVPVARLVRDARAGHG